MTEGKANSCWFKNIVSLARKNDDKIPKPMIMASQCIVKSQNASHISAIYPSGSGVFFFPHHSFCSTSSQA